MSDKYGRFFPGLTSPAYDAFAVTPNNDTDLAQVSRALFMGSNGNIRLTTITGETVTFNGVRAGQILPVRARRVLSTSTTVTNIVALV